MRCECNHDSFFRHKTLIGEGLRGITVTIFGHDGGNFLG
jgi:hypothetical protein